MTNSLLGRNGDLFASILALGLISVATTIHAGAYKADAADKDHYEAVVSKNSELCEYVLGVLNRHKDKARYGEIDDPTFTAIRWTKYGRPSDQSFDYGAEYSKFDVNNDGKVELVIRWRHGARKLIDVDFLFVFPEEMSMNSLHKLAELAGQSIGGVQIEQSYELRSLPPLPRESWMKKDIHYFPILSSSLVMRPFLFEHKHYLLLSESPDVRIDPEIMVVARYRHSHVSSADSSRMEDICYFGRPQPNSTIKRY
jgi:hypothetical protein